jgi:pilus assembly protein Flp/PilA
VNTTIQFIQAWAEARYTNSDRGATMVEYALMVALVAIVAAAGAATLGTGADHLFDAIGDKLQGISVP